MVSTAAASDQLQIGKRRQQFRVLVGERGDIADIDLGRCIEFGVTLGRGIGAQSADAANPGRSALQLAGEMTWMCALIMVRRELECGRTLVTRPKDATAGVFPGFGGVTAIRTAPMSAIGTKQTLMPTMSMSASGGKADIPDPLSNVRL